MKTANEMRKVTNPCTMSLKEKSRAEALEYIEKHIMPEIERVAGTGETFCECSLASINDKGVRQICKDIMQNYGYKADYIDGVLSVYWE